MNIFVTSPCPKESAKFLDNSRVVKMTLETAQMLCSAFYELDSNTNDNITVPYKNTHRNHPCTVWARSSKDNYHWLLEHGMALCNEYTSRYSKIHKSEAVIRWCKENSNKLIFKIETTTPFVNCTTYDNNNVFIAYKNYLKDKWKTDKRKPKWGKGKI